MRVAIVSSYPPRICGIGTFSRDLRESLLGVADVSAVGIAALVREDAEQAPEVIVSIHQEQGGDYAAAARALERRRTDVVMIEHEYGIFGGPDGQHVLSLARELRCPMVLTLHTVLSSPSVGQGETLRALCDEATLVCVFTETARRMIVDAHIVSPERVRVVPHGAPSELLHDSTAGRRTVPAAAPSWPALGPAGARRALATFGLISRGKGIETAIAAMPAIVARHPDTTYLIAGQTHPEVVKREGEEYRLGLERQAHDLGLGDHVIFDDRFLSIGDLATMLAGTDIYLTPYRSREQIVSGALTFAIAAGCPTVSTPYYYAEDLLSTGAGVLVPFDDPAAMAEAVNGLLDDPDELERVRRRARAVGRQLSWPQVARQTADVLDEAIGLGSTRGSAPADTPTLPRARDSHLRTLTDDVGIIQHADGIIPVRESGYCVDDVARLAIVAVGLGRTTGSERYTRMLARSLGFLRHAWDPAVPGMRNFLAYDRRWLDAPHGGDHLGRAAWAVGEVVGAELPTALHEPSRLLLCELLPALAVQRSPRTIALSILGLCRAGAGAAGAPGDELLRELADRLYDQQRGNAGPDWHWAEDILTYDNARLPQALIAAGARLDDAGLLEEGLRALDWYFAQCDVDGRHTRHVGHHGRRRGEPCPGPGDEQPLNAAALVEAQVEAYRATDDDSHGARAMLAFEWFLGRNRLQLAIYDFATGGCRDGLGESALSVNEGAESTLSYLQALLALDGAGLQATRPE